MVLGYGATSRGVLMVVFTCTTELGYGARVWWNVTWGTELGYGDTSRGGRGAARFRKRTPS
eukprot:453437-Rhodomonas_salina.1